MDKIAALNEILQLDPTNAFARYGLAMEYINQNDTDRGLREFAELIALNPEYVPAYQMSAQTLIQQGRYVEALERLDAGMAIAHKTGNTHAYSEMEGLKMDLPR